MRSIVNILENNGAVTALLHNGGLSVNSELVPQSDRVPYIVVELMEEEEQNTMSSTVLTIARARVFTVSDRAYTDSEGGGVLDISALVRIALVGQSGTFDTETIDQVNLESTSRFNESPERIVVEQIFQVFKRV
jgi:hypothetical protein